MSKKESKKPLKLWTCPKCERMFRRKNQIHSCTKYPLEKHFEKKDLAETLYNDLSSKVENQIGSFYVESLPCCIHLVTCAYTFAAVYALRDGIKIHFTLDYEVVNDRIDKSSQMSKHRFLHSIDVKSDKEIDKELIGWIKLAYNMKKQS